MLSSLPSSEEEADYDQAVPSETSSEESLAECLEGVYNGYFEKPVNGEQTQQQYTIEVSHNSNEIIFLATREEGDQLCTTYQNPSFYSYIPDERWYQPNLNIMSYLKSDSKEYKGIIGVVTGIAYYVWQRKEDPMDCSIFSIGFVSDHSASNIFRTYIRRTLERSFAEIKSDCDALEPAQGGGAAR